MFARRFNYVPYVIWLLPMAFFTAQFVIRLWPGLLVQNIMQQLAIDATSFAFLATLYYFAYAGLQIPIAVLLEKFSARTLISGSSVLCGLMLLVFTSTDKYYLAAISRFLMGAGSAIGFLGVSKVIAQYFPKAEYTKMVGLSFTVGLLGAVFGGKPTGLLINYFGWYKVAVGLALFFLGLGGLIFLGLTVFTKNLTVFNASEEKLQFLDLKEILKSKKLWLLAGANLLMVGFLEGFADVWGISYLMKAYAVGKSDAAQLVSFVFFGMLLGGPLLAYFSKKSNNYVVILGCSLGMAACFALLLYTKQYNWLKLAALFFVVGIMCCYQVIVFATASDLVAPKYFGIAIAFLNSINMFGGSIFHFIIGRVLDLHWDGNFITDVVKDYNLEAYKSALCVIPIGSVLGGILIVKLWGAFTLYKKKNQVFAKA